MIVSEIMGGSAALLNDVGQTVFTNAAQLPYFKIAYEDLTMELQDNNIPITSRTSAVITVPALINNIGGLTGPALPDDLVEVIALWERVGVDDEFAFVTKRAFLSKTNGSSSRLREWAWKNQIIEILPVSAITDVKLDYVGNIELLGISDIEDCEMRVFNVNNFLKYRNAALCAEFIGENKERADSLNMNALRTLETLLSISIKGAQNIATRRQRFRRHQ